MTDVPMIFTLIRKLDSTAIITYIYIVKWLHAVITCVYKDVNIEIISEVLSFYPSL